MEAGLAIAFMRYLLRGEKNEEATAPSEGNKGRVPRGVSWGKCLENLGVNQGKMGTDHFLERKQALSRSKADD